MLKVHIRPEDFIAKFQLKIEQRKECNCKGSIIGQPNGFLHNCFPIIQTFLSSAIYLFCSKPQSRQHFSMKWSIFFWPTFIIDYNYIISNTIVNRCQPEYKIPKACHLFELTFNFKQKSKNWLRWCRSYNSKTWFDHSLKHKTLYWKRSMIWYSMHITNPILQHKN